MFAIAKIGGNQYKVALGNKLDVDRLSGNVGDTLEFPALLVVEDKKVVVGKEASKLTVSVKIVEHKRGRKLDVYRFRAKSRHRRHIGFRPDLTTVEVAQIGSKSATQKSASVKSTKTTTAKRTSKAEAASKKSA